MALILGKRGCDGGGDIGVLDADMLWMWSNAPPSLFLGRVLYSISWLVMMIGDTDAFFVGLRSSVDSCFAAPGPDGTLVLRGSEL